LRAHNSGTSWKNWKYTEARKKVNDDTRRLRKVRRLKSMLKSCRLCPRKCSVDITEGAKGFRLESMVSQVGDTLETEGDIARRGIIIRHLVLPGFIQNSIEVLKLIKKTLSTSVPLSIMSQYTPIPPMKDHPLLGRRVTRKEYESVINDALDMGFETVFTQDVDDRAFSPDFERDSPFTWS